jgi:hypothetical protein
VQLREANLELDAKENRLQEALKQKKKLKKAAAAAAGGGGGGMGGKIRAGYCAAAALKGPGSVFSVVSAVGYAACCAVLRHLCTWWVLLCERCLWYTCHCGGHY